MDRARPGAFSAAKPSDESRIGYGNGVIFCWYPYVTLTGNASPGVFWIALPALATELPMKGADAFIVTSSPVSG
ncbi:major facilitator superfamily MFS_1 [Edwardsiella piscicida]|nr:major facilitator superfamily MFS_1 [Edwardsiella piscicida]GAJ66150.1 major facilitator superfamily MFS_1 [Edwardsiella piscicida]